MTEWGLIAVFGIPTAAIMGGSMTALWISLGKEPDVPGPKSHPHTIQFLAERERRLKSQK
ncbi:hypothetical protein [Sporosarcina highlanderae]|uniref:Uncharacterized protein n=1 Tax=Sporosarcina highlanderae TaxID=3035916 RepID=A0ABT8JVF7_9BACL|nr:hypothetical protein [Sporosarcina highlanderae]MDN4609161.1 hypothetical protein [Sporosarcina highlanderae]